MNKSDLITIRPMVESDKNFIMATIMRGLYYGESWFSEIPKNIFMDNYHKTVEYIIAKNDTIVNIACLKEDPDVIIGYSVFSLGVLHWVFCKKAWRGIGVAKSLVPDDTKYVTHLTKTGLSILKKKGWDFNPFKI